MPAMRMTDSPLLLSLALPLFACAPDGVRPDDATGADDVNVETDGSDTTTGMAEMVPARGNIALTAVVVNQGVDVPIAVNGNWVDGPDRNTAILRNRDTLLRAFWEYPDDWTPRNITARLVLDYPDGTTRTFDDTKFIDQPSYPGDIERTFFFGLSADDVVSDIDFHLSLWEGDATGFESLPESSTVIESPIGGPKPIGIQPQPMQMKVVVVPVVYNAGSCHTDTSTISAEDEKKFLDYLYEQNPTQEIEWEFRRDAPLTRNTQLASLTQLHLPLQDLRIQDGAAPNYYYYALVDVCGPGIDDAAGVAAGIPPATMEASPNRVASGVWLPNQKSYAWHTFVHEIGHTQGLSHIFCEGGGSVGNDPAYPYNNGITNVWGFGIRLYQFYSPTANYDYMTYCLPNWVSDWTWTKIFTRIYILSSWDDNLPAPEPEGELLIGLLLNDGSEEWWTVPGGREAEFFSGAASVRFDYDGETLDIPAAYELLEDGTRRVTAPVPRLDQDFSAIAHVEGDEGDHPITLMTRLRAPE